MKLSLALTAITGTTILADTIALGYVSSSHQVRAMWREGQDPCDSSKAAFTSPAIILTSSPPCDYKFMLDNGKSYRVKNCGSASFSLHYFTSQTFISTATWAPWSVNCGGGRTVTKEWQFLCDKPGC